MIDRCRPFFFIKYVEWDSVCFIIVCGVVYKYVNAISKECKWYVKLCI